MNLFYRLGTALVVALVILLIASVAGAQPPIPHPLEGRDDCLSCHQAGIGNAPRVALDHAERSNESCGQCHVPVGVEPETVPTIPHPLEGREACLACHEDGLGGASRIPDDHLGRATETCRRCHFAADATPAVVSPVSLSLPLIPHEAEGREACLTCHEAGLGGASKIPDDHAGRSDEACRQCHIEAGVTLIQVPPIPHPVEGREACLACHAGWIGQAPAAPEDHVGRLNKVCQECHQPPVLVVVGPTPLPIPTPIVHPEAPTKNSCLECHRSLGGRHADITYEWEGSYFATFGVGCADCHGGDPGADDATVAMSQDAGYIGVPDRAAIPYLCGSCHADSERMSAYELPVDQLSEYEKSVHGQRLAAGDESVATCFDCHDGHATQQTDDPGSAVYPTNQPGTCARCHSDEARMRPYGIPTNQYELFQKSVHGVALLEEQNLEAPTCSTCHGSHGATLPGHGEVIDVCGQCHSQAERYYLTGGHSRGQEKDSEAPRCTTCHGRYDVEPASLDLYIGDEPRHCGSCHASDSLEGAAIDATYQTLVRAEQALEATEEALAEARSLGLSGDTLEARLEVAATRLAEAAAAQHEVRLETIEEMTAEAESISVEVREAVETAMTRKEQDRLLPGGIIGVVLVLGSIALVLLRRRSKAG